MMKYLSTSFLLLAASVSVSHAFRNETEMKDFAKLRRLEEQMECEINHDLAQSSQEVRVYVKTFPGDGQGLFDITVYDQPWAPRNSHVTHHGWCIDYDRFIGEGWYRMDIFSAFDPDLHYHDSDPRKRAVDKRQYLPNLAWLINHWTVGQWFSGRVEGKWCSGRINWKEMQGAVWLIIDDKSGYGTWYGQRQDCISKGLKALALEKGNNYVPNCLDVNEEIPIVYVVDNSYGNIQNQVIMSETKLNSIDGMCQCHPKPKTCDDVPDFNLDLKGLPAYKFTTGNPSCEDLGYSFGYKMNGCSNRNACEYDSLSKTSGSCRAGEDNVGSFNLQCSAHDGSGYRDATITPSVDSVVIMKGPYGTGGAVYDGLKAGKTYKLDVGQRKAINRIEFCFRCDGPCPSRAITPEPTASPTGGPTSSPTSSPTGGPTKAPTDNPTGPPTPSPTDSPTSSPTKAPTDPPKTCDDVPDFDLDLKGLPAERFSGNPNCQDMGYSFGYKMESCSSAVNLDYDTLIQTKGTCAGGEEGVGSVTIQCTVPDGSQYREATMTPSVDSVVIMKGGNGGVIYDGLKAGSTYTLDVGAAKGISHMEFCFRCDGPCPSRGVTPEPTAAPTVEETDPPAPDAAPNAAPTPENRNELPPVYVKGDPHFKTFGGEYYDFHGECDLVLLHNPQFKHGLGMDIHIRTKIEDFWSSVESAAMRIGDNTIEIRANAASPEWLWLNGDLVETDPKGSWGKDHLGDFLVRYREASPGVREANIYIEGPKERIQLKTFKSFVRIDVDWVGSLNYNGTMGLLGSWDHEGARLGRDGKTLIHNHRKFGMEWQVLDSEPKLFHSYEGAVVGRKCQMPPAYTREAAAELQLRKRRLAESGMTEEDAEKACAHLRDAEERKSCVYDVIATQDLSMASVW